jgi:alanine racemase
MLPGGVRMDAVIKADAYGHGALGVASWLETRRLVDGLCVATLDEGLELRAGGITLPILVVYAIPADRTAEAVAAGLALTVGDATQLHRTIAALAGGRDAGEAAPEIQLEVQLEVETGLGRAGIDPADVPAVVDRIQATPGLWLGGVWSHLAAPDDRARSASQRRVFETAIEALGRSAGLVVPPQPPPLHLAATGGLLAASAPAYDRVRLGLGLYGLLPDGLNPDPTVAAATELRPVMSLLARPIRVADMPAGLGVSYGPSFTTERPSRIATLPLGYGDGWPRAVSNRAFALVRGHRIPLVGTVAMDAVMADVTDVPGPPVTVDDEFVLLGSQVAAAQAGGSAGAGAEITAAELAQARTSISWEVVTSMARRLPRVYHAASVPVGIRTLVEEVLAWPPELSSGTGISATSRSTRS